MTPVLIRGGRLGHRNTHGVWGGGVMLQEGRGRDGRMQLGAKKKARTAWSHQEVEEAGRIHPQDVWRERSPADPLILNSWPPELREYVSIVLSHLVCILPLQQL